MLQQSSQEIRAELARAKAKLADKASKLASAKLALEAAQLAAAESEQAVALLRQQLEAAETAEAEAARKAAETPAKPIDVGRLLAVGAAMLVDLGLGDDYHTRFPNAAAA